MNLLMYTLTLMVLVFLSGLMVTFKTLCKNMTNYSLRNLKCLMSSAKQHGKLSDLRAVRRTPVPYIKIKENVAINAAQSLEKGVLINDWKERWDE